MKPIDIVNKYKDGMCEFTERTFRYVVYWECRHPGCQKIKFPPLELGSSPCLKADWDICPFNEGSND